MAVFVLGYIPMFSAVCLYSLTGKDVDRLIGVNFDSAETDEEMMALRDAASLSLEKVIILLDRMRKSFACDARLFASVVPLLLEDFVDTTQAMNKMVSEVITSHQPHPVIVAIIMAQVLNLYACGCCKPCLKQAFICVRACIDVAVFVQAWYIPYVTVNVWVS